MKVAICYFGLTRSTRRVYQSHHALLFAPLKAAGAAVDVYMHTWQTDTPCVWFTPAPPLDYDEYKLLEPNAYVIDKQDDFIATIDFGRMFDAELYQRIGDSPDGEWHPRLILNHLCALESQKRAFRIAQASGVAYDHVLFVRPDTQLLTPFDPLWISRPYALLIPDFDHYSGLNDRFAALPFASAAPYACRVDEIAEFRKANGRIVSEKYVKYIADKYYGGVSLAPFRFELIR